MIRSINSVTRLRGAAARLLLRRPHTGSFTTVNRPLAVHIGAIASATRSFSSHRTDPNVSDDELTLIKSLAQLRPTQALERFSSMPTPPSQLLSQKLASMLAKRGDLPQTKRAVEILRAVYQQPALKPDDYTILASIHVVDACIRHALLDEALVIHEEAFNVGVTLDLPAYDALVEALVGADRLEGANDLLETISVDNDLSPNERSYYPLLEALVQRQEYDDATTLLENARARNVQFTSETFHPIVELAEADEDASTSIVTFLSYIETVWAETKLLDQLVDYMEDDDDYDLDDEEDV